MTTDILLGRTDHHVMPSFVTELFRREPLFAGAALCLAILVLPTMFAMAIDQRTFLDLNVWVKPLKFEFTLTIYLATLAWFAGWLPKGVAAARWYRIFTALVVFSVTAEMVWINGAATFGVASHFNDSSPFMIAIYAVMGVLAVFLTSTSLVYGVLILRDRASRLDPAFRLSVGIGLIATFVLTVIVAGYMSSNGGHFVGGNGSDAEGFPLMSWARDGGDLRVAHFFATHAMHVIPVAGFLVGRLLPTSSARWTVLGLAGAYIGFVGYVFVEALSGQAFLAMLP